MVVYIENPKESTKKLLFVINEFGKVAGNKFNIQKFVAFLYTNNELSQKQIKKAVPFTITTKNMVPRDKFNQGNKKPVLIKLKNT